VNDYHERCLRTFMLGAVKRVFQPGCKFELMLVLVGGQGAGKSTLPGAAWPWSRTGSRTNLRRHQRQGVFHRLNGRWIIEMSEMVAPPTPGAIRGRSRPSSPGPGLLRLAYDARRGPSPADACSRAHTNRMDFLPMDRSGNRRFLPCRWTPERRTATSWMTRWVRGVFCAVWAEIMAQYDSGAYTPSVQARGGHAPAGEGVPLPRRTPWPGGSNHYMYQFQGGQALAPCRSSRRLGPSLRRAEGL
jgi:hypothetical protein